MGWFAVWWIETFFRVGRGGGVGLPERFDMDETVFMLNAYALTKTGSRRFNRVFYSRAKGKNKSGKAAGTAAFEGLAPCRFDHWAEEGETYEFLGETYHYRPGEPVGRMVQMPEIICLATAEGQTGNIFDSIYYNCDEGPLSQLKGVGLDVGRTRIGLPEGGEIIPSTSGAASKDGGLETFACCDETHLYNTPKLRNMYKTVQRNLGKRKGDADPWILETSTMYRPGEDSVAESSYKYAWDTASGKVRHRSGIYFDHVYANLDIEDFADEKKTLRALQVAYGASAKSDDGKDYLILPDGRMTVLDENGFDAEGHSYWDGELGPSKDGWIDLNGQMDQIYQPDSDPADSIRYYMNNLSSVHDSWLTESDIQSHLLYRDEMSAAQSNFKLDDAWQSIISPKEPITLGFDGSVSDDSTALVGCRVKDGMLFLIKLQQCPDGPEKATWRVDRDSFDGKARWMLEHYNVVGFFADAARFESMIGGWESDYDKQLKIGPRKSGDKIKFWTNSWTHDMHRALENAHTGFRYPYEKPTGPHVKGDIALLADPRLVNHFRNARRRERSFGYLIFKETPNSPDKIDACMAGVLAYHARCKYLELAEEKAKPKAAPRRLY
ncbi:hypothetical protein [Bifidobacterium eulemuris]|nr:hypothetical protein [Bifidobacterium eulemuris]